MEIHFRTRRLQKIFNSEKNLSREYGSRMAQRIKVRLAVLKNARSLSQVPRTPPDRCHPLAGNRLGQYAVDLAQPYRLVFEPEHDPLPRRDDGGVNLCEVTAITLVGVLDYH